MIYRIDVRTTSLARGGEAAVDPVGEAIRQQIKEFSPAVGAIETSRIFLIDTDAPREHVERVASELLADPIVEQADLILEPPADSGRSRIEIHLKPGVMDPIAASTEMAVRDMGIGINEVRTGRSYVICDKVDQAELKHIATPRTNWRPGRAVLSEPDFCVASTGIRNRVMKRKRAQAICIGWWP